MSKTKIGLHEVIYERLSEAEKRQPHPPMEMRSGNSRGPIKMWVCNEVQCNGVEYTYGSSLEPPWCRGGMKWSFTTNGSFFARIHHSWAR